MRPIPASNTSTTIGRPSIACSGSAPDVDQFVKEVLDTIDDMAERIRMIGQEIENVQLKQMHGPANVHSSVPRQD
jgi:hypothetical protein